MRYRTGAKSPDKEAHLQRQHAPPPAGHWSGRKHGGGMPWKKPYGRSQGLSDPGSRYRHTFRGLPGHLGI